MQQSLVTGEMSIYVNLPKGHWLSSSVSVFARCTAINVGKAMLIKMIRMSLDDETGQSCQTI